MTSRAQILTAAHALLVAALPSAEVLPVGSAKPQRVGAGGLVVMEQPEQGEAAADLSPLAYNFELRLPVALTAYETASLPAPAVVQAMLDAVSAAVLADRTLGGLCHWVELELDSLDDENTEGARAAGAAAISLVASYTTDNPLG